MASRTTPSGWLGHKGRFVDSDVLTSRHFEKAAVGEFEIYPPAQLMYWGAPTETYQRELTAAYKALETL